MKNCTVQGDMTADSAGDQYPTIPLCDDCIEADSKAEGDARIVAIEGERAAGEPGICEWCGAEAGDE